MRRLVSIVLAPVFFSFDAEAKDWLSEVEVSGTIESEWAVTHDDGKSQKFETIVQPEFNYDFVGGASFTALFRLRGDTQYNLESSERDDESRSPFSRRAFLGELIDGELREFYVDMFLGNAALRVGKQQIVWGQADGLKVLDVVNPQSFREFILDEFDDSRIPLWTLNANIPLGEVSQLQLLWIPDKTYHDFPEQGTSYAFTSSRLIPQVPDGYNVVINEANRPAEFIHDSDTAVRFSTFFGGWDITLNYLYHFDDTPVYYRSIEADTITIDPLFERTHLIGGTLSNAFGNFTLRSEVGFATDSYFVTQNTNDEDGIEEFGELSYVVGLDYHGLTNTFLSAQFFRSVLTDNVEGVTREDAESSLTFLVERTFFNETWKAETLFIHSINDSDGIVRPKINFEYASNVNIWVGADIFYGSSDGLYGQFKDESRVYFGLDWGF